MHWAPECLGRGRGQCHLGSRLGSMSQAPQCVSLRGAAPSSDRPPRAPRGGVPSRGSPGSAPPHPPWQAAAQAGALTLGSCPGP